MGYYIELRDGDNFRIKPENVKAALEAARALHEQEYELGKGGSWRDGKKVAGYFAWMNDTNWHEKPTLTELLKEWRFHPFNDPEDEEKTGITGIEDFDGQKIGDEDHLFRALAPFVEPGSYLEFQGEDGECWRLVFDGEGMSEVSGELRFKQPGDPTAEDLEDLREKNRALRDRLKMLQEQAKDLDAALVHRRKTTFEARTQVERLQHKLEQISDLMGTVDNGSSGNTVRRRVLAIIDE